MRFRFFAFLLENISGTILVILRVKTVLVKERLQVYDLNRTCDETVHRTIFHVPAVFVHIEDSFRFLCF